MYYHASQTAGLVCLEPRVSNHGIPLVYLSSKRENVLVYLSNAVEKFCRETGFSHSGRWSKWGPYGFTETGILRLEEYYPHALEDTYRGVSAYIYSADPPRGLEKLEGIADAYVSKEPVPVMGCEYIADACDAILCAEKEGKIVIRRYEEMTPAQLAWIRDTAIQEYGDPQTGPDYRHFLRGRFPFVEQEAGQEKRSREIKK